MAASELEAKPFFERICDAPLAVNNERVSGGLVGLRELESGLEALADLLGGTARGEDCGAQRGDEK